METKKRLSFPFIIIALIVGSALYKQFDFEQHTFENPWLSVIYGITLLFSIYIIIKGVTKGNGNTEN